MYQIIFGNYHLNSRIPIIFSDSASGPGEWDNLAN